jgi:hypothetical protein
MISLVGFASGLNRQRASQIAGFVATAIAVAAFIGCWADMPLLSSWGSGFVPMKFMTGLCLAVLGVALVHPAEDSRLAFLVGLVVAAVALLDLGLLLFGACRRPARAPPS